MNTGQMLTVLFALGLLSTVTLGVNSMLVNKTETMLEAEASLTAISLAQTMIDEVQTKAYDMYTANGGKVYDSTGFTAASSLGASSSELAAVPQPERPDTASPYKSIKYFNDVDDYQNYRRYAYTTMGVFKITDTVYYVSESNPDVKSTTQTFYKKIIITVTHPNMKYPLKLSDVAVYRRYF